MARSSGGPVAALDCGTNSTRLLIVDGDGKKLVRLTHITRLGRGVDATHQLDPDAMERTLAVLTDYRHLMDEHGVVRARLAATSAVRDAANRDDFLDAAREVTGVEPEVLSGVEEGELSYAGATADLPPAEGGDLVVDIGGGSTELVVGSTGRVNAFSMDVGCVRLSERCLQHDPPTADEVAGAVAVIAAELDRAIANTPGLRTLRRDGRLIGLAGTVSTLASLDQGLAEYSYERIHHYVLTRAAVGKWADTLLTDTVAERAKRPGMAPGREDVIAAGALVLREVMDRFGYTQCLVSESDILDGLAASLR